MDKARDRGAAQSSQNPQRRVLDGLGALLMVESAIAESIGVGIAEAVEVPSTNRFDGPLVVERSADGVALLQGLMDKAAEGQRVTAVVEAKQLAAARSVLESIVQKRLGIVVHVLAEPGVGDAMYLADLGWGLLVSGGVLESMDLALVARRAAEDCGTPFFVVHEWGPVRLTEPLDPPSRGALEGYIGHPRARIKRLADIAHPSHAAVGSRAFAERVPFALGSAFRELEAQFGRRHDFFERIPPADAALVVVAMGHLGSAPSAEVERLRHAGHDVGAIRIVSFRPFPGPRLVKALARSLAVTVLEGVDQPHAQSNPLAREIKAAFADAMTWAPEYPGVGRIPRIFSGTIEGPAREVEAADVDAAVHNMVADERGKRSFVLGERSGFALAPVKSAPATVLPMAVRVSLRDASMASLVADLCVAVVASMSGHRVRAALRKVPEAEGGGASVDIVASADRKRVSHAPHGYRAVVLDTVGALGRGPSLARLSSGGTVAIPSVHRTGEAVWGDLPPYAKATLHDCRGKLVAWAPSGMDGRDTQASWLLAAVIASLVASSFAEEAGPSAIAGLPRDLYHALLHVDGAPSEEGARRVVDGAQKVMGGLVHVPKGLIDREDEGIRLGRHDARSARNLH